jgi:hypothetical protein
MRLVLSSLLLCTVLSGSDVVLARSPVSHHVNKQAFSQARVPASDAVFGDLQHAEVETKPVEIYTASSCFPALDFAMPSRPPANLNNWWCEITDEYAFLGFSYEVEACESIFALVSRLRA